MSPGGNRGERGGRSEPTGADDLVALLYGELAPDEAAALRDRLNNDSGMAGHLAAFERVREVYRQLPDEDPPPRVTAELLIQAAAAAPPVHSGRSTRAGADPSGTGWWRRLKSWLAPIALHPGLAAAASLILVAGVAGALYLRKGGDMARPRALEPAADPSRPRPRRPIAVGTEDAPVDALAPAEPAGETEPVEADRPAAARGAGSGRGADESPDKVGSRRKVGRRGAPEPSQRKTPRATDRDRSGDALRPGTVYGMSEPPPAPMEGGGEDKAKNPAARLHRSALEAAREDRCLEVQALDDKVRRADPSYHRDVFRRDRRLASCLTAAGSGTTVKPTQK